MPNTMNAEQSEKFMDIVSVFLKAINRHFRDTGELPGFADDQSLIDAVKHCNVSVEEQTGRRLEGADEFAEDAERYGINQSNSVYFAVKRNTAGRFEEELNKHNIPHITAKTGDAGITAFIVPAFLKEQARAVAEGCRVITELDANEFKRVNANKHIAVFTDISEPEAAMIRQKLGGSGMGFCFEKIGNGVYDAKVPKEYAKEFAVAVAVAKQHYRSTEGRQNSEAYRAKEEMYKDAVERVKKGETLYVGNASGYGKVSSWYEITPNGIYTQNGKALFEKKGSEKEKENRLFESKIHTIIRKSRRPVCKKYEKSTDGISGCPFSNEEIMLAKKSMAWQDTLNGHAEQAEILANRIFDFCIRNGVEPKAIGNYLAGRMMGMDNVLDGIISDDKRKDLEEIADKIPNLGNEELYPILLDLHPEMKDLYPDKMTAENRIEAQKRITEMTEERIRDVAETYMPEIEEQTLDRNGDVISEYDTDERTAEREEDEPSF